MPKNGGSAVNDIGLKAPRHQEDAHDFCILLEHEIEQDKNSLVNKTKKGKGTLTTL